MCKSAVLKEKSVCVCMCKSVCACVCVLVRVYVCFGMCGVCMCMLVRNVCVPACLRAYMGARFLSYGILCCFQAVLENLDLSVPVHISVQTLGSNGLFAEKVHVLHKSGSPPAGSASPTPPLSTPSLGRPSGATQPVSHIDIVRAQ